MTTAQEIRLPESQDDATDRHTWWVLNWATIYFVLAFAFHNADHIRRGTGAITTQVFVAGSLAAVSAVFVVVLVFTRNRFAPLAAVVIGFSTAIGVAATHLLPHWSAFSDSFPSGNIDALTWTAGTLEVVVAFALGLAGWYTLRHTE